MISPDTCRVCWTAQHPLARSDRTVLEFPANSGSRDELSIDANLTDTIASDGSEPPMMLARTIDLGLETDPVEGHEESLLKVHQAVWTRLGA